MQLDPNAQDTLQEMQQKYLLFSLAGEIYACPLLAIREVIKVGAIKSVPYMTSHFKGVTNLRGQIISIIDLREKLGLKPPPQTQGLILIVDCEEGLIGTIIDDVLSVQDFLPNEIENHPNLETRVPVEFLIGIAKMKEQLVNIIDIKRSLSSEDLRMIVKVKQTA